MADRLPQDQGMGGLNGATRPCLPNRSMNRRQSCAFSEVGGASGAGVPRTSQAVLIDDALIIGETGPGIWPSLYLLPQHEQLS